MTPTGTATGGWVSIGGENASRDSLVTTNPEDPTSPIGLVDVASDSYGNTTLDNYIGAYAEAAATARATMGIEDSVRELSDTVDAELEARIDTLLMNTVWGATTPYVQTANDVLDSAPTPGDCLPGTMCASASTSNPYGKYSRLNAEEKRVCRRHHQSCYDSRHGFTRAYDETKRIYGRSSRNDKTDAFRHCFWTIYLTQLGSISFAYQFTRAHEDGAKNNPPREREMDIYNNDYGQKAWANGGHNNRTLNYWSRRCHLFEDWGYLWRLIRN